MECVYFIKIINTSIPISKSNVEIVNFHDIKEGDWFFKFIRRTESLELANLNMKVLVADVISDDKITGIPGNVLNNEEMEGLIDFIKEKEPVMANAGNI